jgi:phosphate transport system permease protein
VNKDNTRPNENRKRSSDFKARGEPAVWILGGTLVIGLLMIFGFLTLIIYNGLSTFYPRPIEVLRLTDGSKIAGEFVRSEKYKPEPDKISSLPESARKELSDNRGYLKRLLYKIGNFDLYHEDYKWAPDYEIIERSQPQDMIYVKRIEWGPFIGKIVSLDRDGNTTGISNLSPAELKEAHREAEKRRRRIQKIERGQLSTVNYYMDRNRLALKKVELKQGKESQTYVNALEKFKTEQETLERRYNELSNEAVSLRQVDSKYTITLADIAGKEKTIKISDIIEFYPSNQLSLGQKIKIYLADGRSF